MSDGWMYWVGVLVGVLAGFAAWFPLGKWEGGRNLRNEAVKTGVARWMPDESGAAKFEWIVPAEKRP
jgi:hypothetical protein